jgi:hypothetical protein
VGVDASRFHPRINPDADVQRAMRAQDAVHDTFSAQHSITSQEAWTVALVAMAVFEVAGRTLVLATRRRQLHSQPTPALA